MDSTIHPAVVLDIVQDMVLIAGPFFIPTKRGGSLLMYNGYTYSRKSSKSKVYFCSRSRTLRCKAKAEVDTIKDTIDIDEIHNHSSQVVVHNKLRSCIKLEVSVK